MSAHVLLNLLNDLIQVLQRSDVQKPRTCSKLSTLRVCNNAHLSICITFWCELIICTLREQILVMSWALQQQPARI